MNFAALPELLLSWVKSQGTTLLQSDKPALSNLEPGQQYGGKVLDNLTSGRFLVQVGSQVLDMNLPAKTQAGDSVSLTYLSAGPRPTFLLNQATVSPAQPVHISNAAQQVNALLRLAQTPASGTATVATATAAASLVSPSNQTTAVRTAMPLVETAKSPGVAASPLTGTTATVQPTITPASMRPIVANVVMLQNFSTALPATTALLTGPNSGLLGQAVDAARAAIPASTTLSPNTLVELPAATRQILPQRLSQTVSESGLFYESHLAKWSRGALSLDVILREPQARLGQDTHTSSNLAELGGMPEDAARLAGRQLQMLEGAPFVWQGLAWPGQTMQWQVREEPAGERGGETGNAPGEWVTELNLTLPRMGGVQAQLGLNGERLRLRLLADEPDTRAVLQAALPMLAKGFVANGLQPVSLQVEDAPRGET